jgi:hypothetical protein
MIQAPGQEPANASFLHIPDKITLSGEDRRVATSKDDLDLRTSETPVSTTPMNGELSFLTTLPLEVLKRGTTTYELTATDVFGHESTKAVVGDDWLRLKKKAGAKGKRR